MESYLIIVSSSNFWPFPYVTEPIYVNSFSYVIPMILIKDTQFRRWHNSIFRQFEEINSLHPLRRVKGLVEH